MLFGALPKIYPRLLGRIFSSTYSEFPRASLHQRIGSCWTLFRLRHSGFSGLGANWHAVLTAAAMTLSPILGQELFVCGYAQTRFADGFNQWIVGVLVATLFALAHLSHAEAGPLGWAFVGAMALQGLVWSRARSAGAPLTLLIVAHMLLLAAYEAPLAGIAVIALGAALGISRMDAWAKAILCAGAASDAASLKRIFPS